MAKKIPPEHIPEGEKNKIRNCYFYGLSHELSGFTIKRAF